MKWLKVWWTLHTSKHWQNFKYIMKHKYFVYRAGRKLGVSRRQLLVHDYSKFFPSEWFAYANHFFRVQANNESHKTGKDEAFDLAWLMHQKRNPHHWQFWVHVYDTEEKLGRASKMPEKYAREMVADWIGAGAAQGQPDCRVWYAKHKSRMCLHPETRILVEDLIRNLYGSVEP